MRDRGSDMAEDSSLDPCHEGRGKGRNDPVTLLSIQTRSTQTGSGTEPVWTSVGTRRDLERSG